MELRRLAPTWTDSLIDDYLNIIRGLTTIAELLDIQRDPKIESIPTDFSDGSIPYVKDGFLVEDNDNLKWDHDDNFLTLQSAIGKQIRIAYDSTNYAEYLVDLAGELHISTTGAKIFIDDYTDDGFVKTINGTGEIKIDTTLYLPVDDYNVEDGAAQGQLAFWDATAGEWVHTETSELVWDDTNKREGINAATPTERLEIGGNLFLNADNNKILLGAGKDLSIYYNGTDGYIKTDEVAASDLHITTGAAKTVVYDTVVYEDLNFDPIRSGGPVATRPDEVTINNVFHKEFTSANNQLCGSGQEIPHNYKLGTVLNPHAHIFLKSGESAGTTGVTFTVYWELRQSTGTTSGSVTMSATSAQLGTTAGANTLFISGNTFAGSSELGAQLSLTIARTAGDAEDIIVTTYGVHYEKDTPGSRTISTK